ncbi:MAG: DUF4625 domain-containing protein [Chitinophagales bacterium]
MKTIKIIFILFAIISTLLISCDKDDNKDTTAPTITINSPTNGIEGLMSGDTVNISISITDNDDVHESNAVLTHTHMGATTEVWTMGGHQHGNEVMIEGEYIIAVTAMHNDFVLEVTANDHSGNEATTSASFHVHM